MPCSFGNSQIVCSHACIRLLPTVNLSEGPKNKTDLFQKYTCFTRKMNQESFLQPFGVPNITGLAINLYSTNKKTVCPFSFHKWSEGHFSVLISRSLRGTCTSCLTLLGRWGDPWDSSWASPSSLSTKRGSEQGRKWSRLS